MDKAFSDTLTRVLDDLQMLSPDAFRLGGGPVHHSGEPPMIGGIPPGIPVTAPLVPVMNGVLYWFIYAHRYPDPPNASGIAPDPQLPLRLDQANQSRDQWSVGWRVFHIGPDGTVSVSRGETQRMARPGEYLATNGRSAIPAIGEMVTIHMPRGSHTTQPSFYYMFSEEPIDVWSDHALFRFYFKTTPQGVPFLLEWLTATLNGFQVPFRMKALTDPAQYTRSDTTVLYVARQYADIVARLLADPSLPEAAHLQDPTPFFTYRIAPGIGIADDPGGQESFGMNRCRLISEAVIACFAEGKADTATWLEAIAERFKQDGLDLERPWLGAHKSDIFDALVQREQAA